MGDALPRGATPNFCFVDRVADTEDQFVDMLKNCRKQISESGKTQGAVITCCAVYTFAKDIKDLSSIQINDYGMGKLERVRLVTGEKILPLPEWMESRVDLRANFGEKVGTKRKHSSGDSSKKGFEVPWTAHVRLESVPLGCVLESVQLSFINPDADGSPVVKINVSAQDAGNLYVVNDKLMNIKGQTYSECCRGLGIFRQAFCYITLRVPLRLLIREQLQQLRSGLPIVPSASVQKNYSGKDNVTLKCGQSSITVDREILINISEEMESVFGKKKSIEVSVCKMGVSKEVILAVLGSVEAQTDYHSLDPDTTTPAFLYDLMTLSTDWNARSKLWTQLALLERLCAPGFDLEQVPIVDALECVKKDYDVGRNYCGAEMVVVGFAFVLRDMLGAGHVPTPIRISLQRIITAIVKDTAPMKFVESSAESDEEEAQRSYQRNTSCHKYIVDMTGRMTITIISLTGKHTCMAVSKEDTIENVKAAYQEIEGVPVDQQRVMFSGKQLEDGRTLSDYAIPDGAMLHGVLRITGC